MKFSKQFPLQFSAEQVWSVTSDPSFTREAYDIAGADYDILADSLQGTKRVIEARIQFRAELPKLVQKLLRQQHLSYTQTLEIDSEHKRGKWSIKVKGAGSKIKAGGFYQIVPNQEHSVRVFTGEVHVTVPLIGGKIEKEIAKSLEASQQKTVDLIVKKLTSS